MNTERIHFRKVSVVGVGLIGGSLAIVLKEKGLCDTVVGVGRGTENLRTAERLGIIDSYTTDIAEGVRDSDLVFISVPVLSIAKVVKEAAPHLKKGCIVTDAGSVKGGVVAEVDPLMPEGVFFVGGHPIAGTEHSGASAAFGTLFHGRKCILTPTGDTDPGALRKVKAMWEAAGSEVVVMDPCTHDITVAAISHLPHVVAYTPVNTVADIEEMNHDVLAYSAGGFKDFTRIASSSPEMWRDICVVNKYALLEVIEDFQNRLGRIREHIEKEDLDEIQREFERAKKVRDSLKE